jgi:hypothetical protein
VITYDQIIPALTVAGLLAAARTLWKVSTQLARIDQSVKDHDRRITHLEAVE